MLEVLIVPGLGGGPAAEDSMLLFSLYFLHLTLQGSPTKEGKKH